MNVTPDNIKSLKPNEIFVFGSNMAGYHGAGAAKLAREKFGAEYKIGEGITGRTYALPTKDEFIKTMLLEEINYHVKKLHKTVISRPDLHFLITKVGCGLAGYTEEQIAPMFKDFIDLDNVSLPIEFIKIINNVRTD